MERSASTSRDARRVIHPTMETAQPWRWDGGYDPRHADPHPRLHQRSLHLDPQQRPERHTHVGPPAVLDPDDPLRQRWLVPAEPNHQVAKPRLRRSGPPAPPRACGTRSRCATRTTNFKSLRHTTHSARATSWTPTVGLLRPPLACRDLFGGRESHRTEDRMFDGLKRTPQPEPPHRLAELRPHEGEATHEAGNAEPRRLEQAVERDSHAATPAHLRATRFSRLSCSGPQRPSPAARFNHTIFEPRPPTGRTVLFQFVDSSSHPFDGRPGRVEESRRPRHAPIHDSGMTPSTTRRDVFEQTA